MDAFANLSRTTHEHRAWPHHGVLMLLALLVFFSGCEPRKPTAGEGATTNATASTSSRDGALEASTSATTDSSAKQNARESSPAKDAILVARSKSLPENPRRIVSMAPNITEILYALDYGDQVVGVTRFCDWPEQVKQKTRIGGFIDPDMEVILSLEPDLVIGMVAGDAKIVDKLEKANIPYAFLKMDHFDATYGGIAHVGALLGADGEGKKKADALVAKMRQDVHKSATASQARLTEQKKSAPSALFVLGHKPLIVAGKRTFGDELITLSGAKNAAANLDGSYPQVDLEKLLQINPDVIIDATMTPSSANTNDDFWKSFGSLEAVKNKRVATFEDPSLLRPGPRLPEALERFSRSISPEEK
ncbi:MAG: helical backbone metal receptor [Myxococcota bacterium]|nr:helical backbone metal receptor [Myxococcota bacterium]